VVGFVNVKTDYHRSTERAVAAAAGRLLLQSTAATDEPNVVLDHMAYPSDVSLARLGRRFAAIARTIGNSTLLDIL
jgi:hypothetical protein